MRHPPAGLALALIVVPAGAQAHMPVDGIEGFYRGLLHPVTTPAQLLGLLALGAMLGLAWPKAYGPAWASAALAAVLGMVLGQAGIAPAEASGALLAVAALAATAAALLPGGRTTLLLALSAGGGLLLGIVSSPEPGPLRAVLMTSAGVFAGLNLALLAVSGAFVVLRQGFPQDWMRVGLRIVAAWIAAISVLMAALAFTAA